VDKAAPKQQINKRSIVKIVTSALHLSYGFKGSQSQKSQKRVASIPIIPSVPVGAPLRPSQQITTMAQRWHRPEYPSSLQLIFVFIYWIDSYGNCKTTLKQTMFNKYKKSNF